MAKKQKRPNVLFITADQWRADCLSLAGHPVVKTPNVDALAAEGVAFLRHYANAAPCAPARACIYTGRYQMTNRVVRNGTPLDHRFDNIARMARRLGYDPTLFGYTDVGPDPRRHDAGDPVLSSYEGVLPGFSVRQLLPEHQRQWLSWLAARGHDVSAGSPAIHVPPGRHGRVDRTPPVYSADETETAFMAGEFLRWMGEQETGHAWFAHLSFIRPHPPFSVPTPYNEMYDAERGPDFSRAASIADEAAIHPYVAWELGRQKLAKFMPGLGGKVAKLDDRDWRTIRALYWGMVSEVDAQLGRIFDALRAAGLWDDTIIVVTSDHGETMGDHFMLGKGGFFDGSFAVPLVVRDPRRKSGLGTRVQHFTGAVDLMPTLAALLGAGDMPWLDGRSLAPFLEGESPKGWREAAHWEFDFRSISTDRTEAALGTDASGSALAVMRTGTHKYVHFSGMPPLLFDLAADPHETRNVVDEPHYRSVRLDMAEAMLAWRSRHLDRSLALCELTPSGIAGSFAPAY